MTTRTTWEALAQRCREATGPDRQLDADIQRMFDGRACFRPGIGWKRWWPETSRWGYLEPVTGKIDAIVSLIEKTLPGWWWELESFVARSDSIDSKPRAVIGHYDRAGETKGEAKTPALALCAAYCMARAGMEDDTP